MANYYAVGKGRTPGVYLTWAECEKQVTGFPGAHFKKFGTQAEAEAFVAADAKNRKQANEPRANGKSTMRDAEASLSEKTEKKMPSRSKAPVITALSAVTEEDVLAEFDGVDTEALAYVDGSFNAASGVYGFGGLLLMRDGSFRELQGNGTDPELSAMRNVTGEIYGAMAAVRAAEEAGLHSLTIFYDYKGIEMWARGLWKTNKEGTRAYARFMQEAETRIHITFRKVAAHTGVRFNECVDRIAKNAVGNS